MVVCVSVLLVCGAHAVRQSRAVWAFILPSVVWWSGHGAVKSRGVFLSGCKVCDDDFLCVSLIPLV